MGLLSRLSLVSGALVSVAGAACYHTEILNNPWCSSFRVIRFGRATNAVKFCKPCSFMSDYITLIGLLGGTRLQVVHERLVMEH